MDKTLVYLEQISENLQYVDYEMIYNAIKEMRNKAVPSTLLKKGGYVDRVRINEKEEIFNNESSVSYIKNKAILESRKEFGRANLPNQPMFYGSVASTLIDIPRAVAFFETTELLDDRSKLEGMKEVEQIFTHSRWRVIEDIELAEIIYSDEALKINPDVQTALKYHEQFIIGHDQKEHFEDQLRFFSNQFARVKKYSDHEYKISCAYANYILDSTSLGGIAYPSVPSEYKGQNVVLRPEVVDNSLKLEKVGMSFFKRKNFTNLPIECFKVCTELGEGNQSFKWVDPS
jgi:hypothetical protein